MKQTLLTISLLLSLTAGAAENEQPSSTQTNTPATAQAAQPASDVIPCPLPGEPATNCPAPREPEVTEAGTGATAGGNVHNVLHLGLLLSSPKGNALHEGNGNQTLPSPLRPPVKDEK
ncbi:MAG: hypothetical protein K0R29_1967 [Pseudobdellovibrio sp.]|jgi:hypothetical protein|nr:hypothetical protein [Pseudobdellovibrio sp.]